MAYLQPHLFRKYRNPSEMSPTGNFREKVPLDAGTTYRKFRERKMDKFTKAMRANYCLQTAKPLGVPKHLIWCVTTGRYVPEFLITPMHIFPEDLCPSVYDAVFKKTDLWNGSNGLMVPHNVKAAMEDWALIIVPQEIRQSYRGAFLEYKFRVVDPAYKGLESTIYKQNHKDPAPITFVKELDGHPLVFRNNSGAPLHRNLYFHSGCAIWKKTFLELPPPPDGAQKDGEVAAAITAAAAATADFWARFQKNMIELWGRDMVMNDRSTNVFNPLYDLRDNKDDDDYVDSFEDMRKITEIKKKTKKKEISSF